MKKSRLLFTAMGLWLFIACSKNTDTVTPSNSNPDWTTESHSNEADPNYTMVFPQDKVNSLEITMTKETWQAIRTDMISVKGGDFGVGGTQPVGGVGGVNSSTEPKYAAVSIKFNGKEWQKVGFRLKGNSSLSSIWRGGIYKLPFRMQFDEFEEQYPDIKDQRFYGFKDVSMSPAFKDNSLIREKVASDIFRMAGIPVAQTAFYKVYINFGDGLKYCGVYTMIEAIDDTMLKSQFGEKKGNLYKPESTFQTFSQTQFEKKSNEDLADWSDIQATITALNATTRTSNPTIWRENLEKTFNADHFIKWLAINTTLVSWDTYGAMAHNHYLYNHSSKKFMWIPWDNNEALTSNARVQLSLSGVANNWPLINYVANDPVYYAKYKAYVKDFNDNIFTATKMNAIFDKATTLITPYVNGTEKEEKPYSNLTNISSFTSALPILKQHVMSRNQAVSAFLR
ncbi:CotH kinase family protein [Emticicia sp.]|uniref:CotH kinase family protein n=1 Tax=Emticicia sp. TaxID=1930953 RepID=UPI003752EC65